MNMTVVIVPRECVRDFGVVHHGARLQLIGLSTLSTMRVAGQGGQEGSMFGVQSGA